MSRGAVKSAFNTVIFQAKVEVRKNQDLCEPSVNRKPGGCSKNSQHPLVTEKVVQEAWLHCYFFFPTQTVHQPTRKGFLKQTVGCIPEL